jgi:hypothetical protein
MSRRSASTKKRSTIHSVRFDTGDGFGSTNTKIRKFTTSTTTGTGHGMVATNSATLGYYVTLNKKGIYLISYQDDSTTNNNDKAISYNISGAEFTTNAGSLGASVLLSLGTSHLDGTDMGTMFFCGYLEGGTVVYPHGDGNQNKTSNVFFEVVRIM